VPNTSRKFAPLAVHQRDADHGRQKIHNRENHVAPVRAQIAQSALQQNARVVPDDRVHAGRRVAKQNYAGQQKGN
jgi:hypothetical protein